MESNWIGVELRGDKDHVFVLPGIMYRMSGQVTATSDGQGHTRVRGSVTMEMRKVYNFDPWKHPLTLRGSETMTIDRPW
ncbi:hypothetical protein [Actinokineospora sp. NBRC 105648]|uniref:hypothetical protein n=1 Tax=Actinokineospora sp. NBRC 105648 TaxID=3032206 RepID=UPI0024A310C2|nr:hypothetical protein [Actinokineospora sp. NBRC 105648]GLZ38150.1 hypothetical protein Acsp05_17740 [Actinokineospora sp. NBRC 105648]